MLMTYLVFVKLCAICIFLDFALLEKMGASLWLMSFFFFTVTL